MSTEHCPAQSRNFLRCVSICLRCDDSEQYANQFLSQRQSTERRNLSQHRHDRNRTYIMNKLVLAVFGVECALLHRPQLEREPRANLLQPNLFAVLEYVSAQ